MFQQARKVTTPCIHSLIPQTCFKHLLTVAYAAFWGLRIHQRRAHRIVLLAPSVWRLWLGTPPTASGPHPSFHLHVRRSFAASDGVFQRCFTCTWGCSLTTHLSSFHTLPLSGAWRHVERVSSARTCVLRGAQARPLPDASHLPI